MKQWVITFVAKWLAGGIIRDIAEGKKGARAKAAYWWLVGKKTATSAVCAVLVAGFAYFQPVLFHSWGPVIIAVVGVGVFAGIVDAQWREAGPLPEWAPVFAKLMSAGPALSAAVAFLVEVLQKMPDTRCGWCDPLALKIQLAAAAVAAATAWLAANYTAPPAITD